jgi:undecaprenyl-diphosphatase
MEFEISIFEQLHALVGLSSISDFFIIFFARWLPYIFFVFIFVYLIRERDWRKKVYNFSLKALSLILARGLILETIQFFYHRARPPLILSINPLIPIPDSSSFPSGHATIFFALGMALFYMHRTWGTIFLIGAALISIARVIAGAHWPFDILAGSLIGVVSAVIIKKLLDRRKALS